DRIGAKRPVVLGSVIAAVGFFVWAGQVTSLKVGSQTIWIIVAGAGMGLMLGQANTDAVNRAGRFSYGEATGITQTVRNYGASLGFAILGTVLINRFRSEITSSLISRGMPGPAAASAIEVVLYGMAIIMGIAALVALRGLRGGVQQELQAPAADRGDNDEQPV